jgi:hypothetical protein
MSAILTWIEQALIYVVAVTGLGALCFVAMKLLA